jgi:hypothetical protein
MLWLSNLCVSVILLLLLFAALPPASPPLKALSSSSILPGKTQYTLKRAMDAWKYGSGSDFKL